ncbi:MAG: GNAT family N-acetyltransferase [Candidatus Promineofilum sp.]|nr:GNAT family N-acetyltransferase [Promineifilum sp.]
MVRLSPMTDDEFQPYYQDAVREYAQEHVEAGNWHPSVAIEESEKQFRQLLPDGVASKDQYLYAIVDDSSGLKVGMLWFAVRYQSGISPYAFVYDFRVDEQFRRRGYGRQAFEVLEEKVKELGLDSITLHVFGHNHAAIALYQAAGYEITDLQMVKKLAD